MAVSYTHLRGTVQQQPVAAALGVADAGSAAVVYGHHGHTHGSISAVDQCRHICSNVAAVMDIGGFS